MYRNLYFYNRLFDMGSKGLENLQLDLSLSDILLASIAAGDLLGLGDTSTDSVSAEVLQGVSLGGVDAQDGVGLDRGKATGQEELLGGAALLDNLDHAGLELLDGRDVVGEDTHVTGLRGNVDLDDILGLVDGLVRQGQAQLDLVGDGLGVSSPLEGHSHG